MKKCASCSSKMQLDPRTAFYIDPMWTCKCGYMEVAELVICEAYDKDQSIECRRRNCPHSEVHREIETCTPLFCDIPKCNVLCVIPKRIICDHKNDGICYEWNCKHRMQHKPNEYCIAHKCRAVNKEVSCRVEEV